MTLNKIFEFKVKFDLEGQGQPTPTRASSEEATYTHGLYVLK